MNNKEFSKIMEERTIDFTVNMIKFSEALPNSSEALVIRNQISKSASSIGANYHEANRARSQRDFKNKIKISESEANETIYWLKVIRALNWSDENIIDDNLKESHELLAIFTSIVNKM